jgi:prepilin-type processing-associated H-X9-DG protein
MAYWGYLSYGINEDVLGAEVAESRGAAACFRAIWQDGDDCVECLGEFHYSPAHPCGRDNAGWRLRGNLDKVQQPSDVGMIFETGRDDEDDQVTGFANLVLSAQAQGPFLGDFQQFHRARMPTTRHPRGAINVLYADLHGGTVRPVEYDPEFNLPMRYTPRVRISPYQVGCD